MDYPELFRRIEKLIKVNTTVNVAIDGMSGAGKSTLASIIKESYDCNVFHMDDFFLTPELRNKERLTEIGGNIDYVRFRHEITEPLIRGVDFYYRAYNCKTCKLSAPIKVFHKKINIIEGVYSLHPFLRDAYDLKVFMRTDENIQHNRILHRSGKALFQRFLSEWIPLENRYFEHFEIEKLCNLVYCS